ncbi:MULTISPECIES: hypothetical protein [unclassified Nocardioides]|uniref:hypothetical protein n=1 Tax=unclassified Nocardioides TaxID=2615069 RepID=UPI00070381C6|nr:MULTISPECIES: hypothetical protein [unclassified Nocardioides]KRC53168.1 hypothetical protein ASE19_12375 [Nocardioides sp. Root79]KRC72696.1 hypothetical protein ASE20_08900 [Nocardioides sp. Root240]
MTPMKRPLVAASATVLLALSLSACGGAPTDASKDDYCKAVNSFEGNDDLIKAVTDEDWDKAADLVKDAVGEIEDVGTPEDIPDDAREGFEIQIDAAEGISGDDFEKAMKDQEDPFEAGLSGDEKKKVEAYNDYENETCSDSDSDSGSDSGSSDDATEVPSIDPEDLPSIDPDDIPSIDPSDFASIDPDDLASMQSELAELTEGIPTE